MAVRLFRSLIYWVLTEWCNQLLTGPSLQCEITLLLTFPGARMKTQPIRSMCPCWMSWPIRRLCFHQWEGRPVTQVTEARLSKADHETCLKMREECIIRVMKEVNAICLILSKRKWVAESFDSNKAILFFKKLTNTNPILGWFLALCFINFTRVNRSWERTWAWQLNTNVSPKILQRFYSNLQEIK